MPKERKILFIPRWFPNREVPYSGIFVLRHARAVARHATIYTLYARAVSKINGYIEKEEKTEPGIISINYYYPKKISGITVLDKVLKLILYFTCMVKGYLVIKRKYGKPDLIHVHILLRTAVFAYILKLFTRTNYIITEHWSGYLPESNQYKGIFRKFISQFIVSKAKWVTAVSQKLKEGMITRGLTHPQFTVVPNVIDTEVFHPSIDTPKDSQSIILIADLIDDIKNISGVLDALSLVHKKSIPFKLDIYGEGKDRQKLENLVIDYGLTKHVSFKGEVIPSVLSKAVAESAFLVLFSNFETFSCVIAEAFAAGTPVIATNTGAIPELVKPEFGILVKPKDVMALAEGIIFMLENASTYNTEQLRNFSVENFSYDKVGNQFREIYEKAIQQQ